VRNAAALRRGSGVPTHTNLIQATSILSFIPQFVHPCLANVLRFVITSILSHPHPHFHAHSPLSPRSLSCASCAHRHITHTLSALDQPDALPIYHLRLPLIAVHNALLPSKRCQLFDTLKALPALPPPDNLAPALLPATRPAHLHNECELGIPRHLTIARPIELLHALAWLILLREHPAPGHHRREGQLCADEWA